MVSLYILDIAYHVYKDSVYISHRILGSLLGTNWNLCVCVCVSVSFHYQIMLQTLPLRATTVN